MQTYCGLSALDWFILLGIFCLVATSYYFGFENGKTHAIDNTCSEKTSNSTSGPKIGGILPSRMKRASENQNQDEKAAENNLCECWFKWGFNIIIIFYLLSVCGLGICLKIGCLKMAITGEWWPWYIPLNVNVSHCYCLTAQNDWS